MNQIRELSRAELEETMQKLRQQQVSGRARRVVPPAPPVPAPQASSRKQRRPRHVPSPDVPAELESERAAHRDAHEGAVYRVAQRS